MLDFLELVFKFVLALTAFNAVLLLTWIAIIEYNCYRNKRTLGEVVTYVERRHADDSLDDVYEQNRNIIDPLY